MKKALVVATSNQNAIFFGYGEITESKTIQLANAYMCICANVMELAGIGPENCEVIGPATPTVMVHDVVVVIEASGKAIRAFNDAYPINMPPIPK